MTEKLRGVLRIAERGEEKGRYLWRICEEYVVTARADPGSELTPVCLDRAGANGWLVQLLSRVRLL